MSSNWNQPPADRRSAEPLAPKTGGLLSEYKSQKLPPLKRLDKSQQFVGPRAKPTVPLSPIEEEKPLPAKSASPAPSLPGQFKAKKTVPLAPLSTADQEQKPVPRRAAPPPLLPGARAQARSSRNTSAPSPSLSGTQTQTPSQRSSVSAAVAVSAQSPAQSSSRPASNNSLGISTKNAQPNNSLGISTKNAQSNNSLGISTKNAQSNNSLGISAKNAQPNNSLGISAKNAQSSNSLGISAKNKRRGLLSGTLDRVYQWSDKMAVLVGHTPQPPAPYMDRYRPPVTAPPRPAAPIPAQTALSLQHKRWKRSLTLRVTRQMRQRRSRWQQGGMGGTNLLRNLSVALAVILVCISLSGTAYGYEYYQSQFARSADAGRSLLVTEYPCL